MWKGVSLMTVPAWTNQTSKNRLGWSDIESLIGSQGLPSRRFRLTRGRRWRCPGFDIPLLRPQRLEQQQQLLRRALHLRLELRHPSLEQHVRKHQRDGN